MTKPLLTDAQRESLLANGRARAAGSLAGCWVLPRP